MSIHVAIHHRTRYVFDRTVGLAPHVVRLRPAAHSRTPILAYSLKIEPTDHFINWQQDPFGNYLARLVFPEKARELSVEVEVLADLTVINPFDFFLEEEAEEFPFRYDEASLRDLKPYLELADNGPVFERWLKGIDRRPRRTIDFLVDLNRKVYEEVDYSIRMEPGVQSPQETLDRAIGSCRDSAWLLVQALRSVGLAARFVSGYIVQLRADVEALDGPSGPAADFTDLHAWAEVYLPGAGWIGLDATSGLFAGEGHIPLACTPEPGSAAPISGATDECEVTFSFSNDVTRIFEDPRVTKPYTEDQWAAIDALGRKVDADLVAADVRLTMGGEPTFVSIDDMESAQWNTAADGIHKRALAEQLTRSLADHFAPGGVTHYAQGKWYPGEPLPRWKKSVYWRADGVPLWQNLELLGHPEQRLGHNFSVAEAFALKLADILRLDSQCFMPAFEDAVYHAWREGTLPVEELGVRSANGKEQADEAGERAALLARLDAGLGAPVAMVMPLEYDTVTGSFVTGHWPLRRGRLVLSPGDSPAGMRLPLDSLPWYSEVELPDQPPDPFESRPPLQQSVPVSRPSGTPEAPAPARYKPSGWTRVIHTALCVEVRDGSTRVFLPPLASLEAWVALLAQLEAAADAVGAPIVLEGYEPPHDPRLKEFAVTPDPGVIEVNIHPAHSWEELRDNTHAVYDIAWQCRLGTEKFMLDGRHTGTGGGNHVTLGAAHVNDSPLLRRPELLKSLVTYWQVHPALSYLFSGLFIGPTSQAPRVDEARDDQLYELEIALAQVPPGECATPWLVDRLFRNLLTDLTGNTHRAEFCIDKLYSPDSATGRRGLLELRAFEMPPTARMSLVQMLLLRTLVSMFWQQPLHRAPVRWGTALHDKFMLAHFNWEDVRDVVGDMQAAGYPFQLEWLAPFLEFRFPRLGTVQIGDIELELRTAIEPWHVLGEEVTGTGTARYVDSSVERVQVKARGLTDSRYVLCCNGRRVKLAPTALDGEYVGGVRFQAWQPPSSMHPTIPPHSPLVFDLVDTWNGRAIGGFSYSVAHPGGLAHEQFPVNAFEAESRRVPRFQPFGHTPGPLPIQSSLRGLAEFLPRGSGLVPMAPPAEEPDGRFPVTLDLRKPAF